MTRLEELELQCKEIANKNPDKHKNDYPTDEIRTQAWLKWKRESIELAEEYIAEKERVEKEKSTMAQTRDSKGRFVSTKTTEYGNANTTTNKKENNTMNNSRENRMETLKNAGVNTDNFFNVNVQVPMGSTIQILVDGKPYTVNAVGNEVQSIVGTNGVNVTGVVSDKVVEKIMEQGYVFNRKTDGRFVCAQTFKMLNEQSYNYKERCYETGWDAYLRNRYGYVYQFEMLSDELHKLAKMQRDNDPEFERLSKFFTKEVAVELCRQYVRQLRKYIDNQKVRRCRREPYVKLKEYGNVYHKDLNNKVFIPMNSVIEIIKGSRNYTDLERNFNAFVKLLNKLPFDTPKCPQWKDAFKGKGAYVTLLNIIKFHGVKIISPETGEVLNTYDSVAYVESKLEEYKGEYWRFHELLKYTIKANDFDLDKSIKSQQ